MADITEDPTTPITDVVGNGVSIEEKRLPHAKWQLVEVTFTTANTDKVIPHTLNPRDPNVVKFEVMDRNVPGSVYRGAKAAAVDYIVLRSTVAGVFHIRLYVPAHFAGSKIPATTYVPAVSTHPLLDGSIVSDTLAGAVARGDIIVGNSTPLWARKAIGTGVLVGDGVDVTGWTKNPTLGTPIVDTKLNLTGGAIAFPATQVADAGANVLDDYEEGTWTPNLAGDVSGSAVHIIQVGRYTKVGRSVFCSVYISYSSNGTMVGNAIINGLPFVVANLSNVYHGFNISYWTGMATNQANFGGYLPPNTSILQLLKYLTTNTGTTLSQPADFGAGEFIFSFHYITTT